jgi:mandelate racemase
MTATLTIRDIRARPVMVPFRRPPVSASGALARGARARRPETEEGITGRSYLFAFGQWAPSPSWLAFHMRDLLKGDACAPIELDAKLRRQLKLLDTPGLVGLALAGIDMAAWDAVAQAQGVPLVKVLGGQPRPVRAYNSCGLWIQPVGQLADDAETLVAEGGFTAIKLRVGRDDPAEDWRGAR